MAYIHYSDSWDPAAGSRLARVSQMSLVPVTAGAARAAPGLQGVLARSGMKNGKVASLELF